MKVKKLEGFHSSSGTLLPVPIISLKSQRKLTIVRSSVSQNLPLRSFEKPLTRPEENLTTSINMTSIAALKEGRVQTEVVAPVGRRGVAVCGVVSNKNLHPAKGLGQTVDEMEIFGSIFKVHVLGSGSFGVLYRGLNVETQELVAIKTENICKMGSTARATVNKESEILRSLQGVNGVPKWINYGSNGINRILMMELLGPSLRDLLIICGGTMSPKTVHMLAIQLLSRLEAIHYRNVLHRDVKPSNIVIGRGEGAKNTYLIDFGLSRFFRHPDTLEHIPQRANRRKSIIGTSRFASIGCHLGLEMSRRDDLESLAYTLIYLLKGVLPWQTVNHQVSSKQEEADRILKKKMETPMAELCKDLPAVFSKLVIYSRNLTMDAAPDYSYLKQIFIHSMNACEFVYDYKYDWVGVEDPTFNEVRHNEDARINQRSNIAKPFEGEYVTDFASNNCSNQIQTCFNNEYRTLPVSTQFQFQYPCLFGNQRQPYSSQMAIPHQSTQRETLPDYNPWNQIPISRCEFQTGQCNDLQAYASQFKISRHNPTFGLTNIETNNIYYTRCYCGGDFEKLCYYCSDRLFTRFKTF